EMIEDFLRDSLSEKRKFYDSLNSLRS
ncbi:unnamed protein product, partial [Oikopleura dioica]